MNASRESREPALSRQLWRHLGTDRLWDGEELARELMETPGVFYGDPVPLMLESEVGNVLGCMLFGISGFERVS